MLAISLLVNVDHLSGARRMVDLQPARESYPAVGWVHFNEFALHGSNPVAFRALAAQCLTAAGLLEQAPSAAESPKTVGVL